MVNGQVSPDGAWVWNGSQWVPNTYAAAAGAPPVQAAQSYAGFGRRLVALVIDGIILVIVNSIVRFALGTTVSDSTTLTSISFVVQVVLGWIYAATLISSGNQGTFGQMLLGIRVTDLNGNPVSFARATGRHFAGYISALLCLIGGYLFMLFTARRQTLHDLIAGTVVVRR